MNSEWKSIGRKLQRMHVGGQLIRMEPRIGFALQMLRLSPIFGFLSLSRRRHSISLAIGKPAWLKDLRRTERQRVAKKTLENSFDSTFAAMDFKV
jgi:hypothetical protein